MKKGTKVLLGVLAFIVVFFLFIFIAALIKSSNQKKLAAEQASIEAEIEQQSSELASKQEAMEDKQETTQSSYQASLGINTGNSTKTDIKVKPTEEETSPTETEPLKPSYDLTVQVFDHTGVPTRNNDGSSYKGYLSKVTLSDFGSKWGTALTEADFTSYNKVLVGVEQNPDNTEIGDLQSTGWLIEHLDELADDTAIRFTNLHVVGSLSDTHLAVLCSYDWYSAFGMKNTLVVFEDISGTLDKNMLGDGDIFEGTVFKHNTKVVNVNGQNVICVQYNTY